MEVREFHPYDLDRMNVSALPRLGGETLTQHAMALQAHGSCWTATVRGDAIASIGLITFWEGRRYAWAFLADDFPQHALSITRAIHRWLRYHGAGRIETAVEPRDEKAVRWAERFGFVREGLMRHWTPEGTDMYLYARVR